MSTTARAAPLVLLALLLLWGCGTREEPVYREQLLVFGTLVDITIYGAETAHAQRAAAAIAADLEQLHASWHAWEPGALARTNQLLATTGRFAANPSVLPLITRAQQLSTASGGLFNPAIGNLVRAWGFHADLPAASEPPSAAEIERLLAERPRMEDIVIEGLMLRGTNPALRLDFGAFAKGVAVDLAIERLRDDFDIPNAIVNAGGDLRAIGRRGERAWRIGIRDPRGPGILASVEVDGDESVFTSGDYERYFEHEGMRYHHILDPRTGYPATGVSSVTVIHENAGDADAAATALFVAGPQDWHAVARAMGIRYVMVVDAEGSVHMNPAMAERVRFETPERPHIVLSPDL
jgi:FAD:protein FMN transferase